MPTPTERIFPAQPVALGRGLGPGAFAFDLTGEDHLRVEAANLAVVGTVYITGRFRRADDGRVQVFERAMVTQSGFIAIRQHFPLEAGQLLNLRLSTDHATARYGELFARAQIIRGLTGAQVVLGTLLQGYISATNDLGWPGTPLQTMQEGRGLLESRAWTVTAAPPLARYTVPQGRRERIICGFQLLIASAAAGARAVICQVQDPAGNTVYSIGAETTQAAGTTEAYSIGLGIAPAEQDANTRHRIALPADLELSAGWSIQLQCVNFQAGDAFAASNLATLTWLDALV